MAKKLKNLLVAAEQDTDFGVGGGGRWEGGGGGLVRGDSTEVYRKVALPKEIPNDELLLLKMKAMITSWVNESDDNG